MTKTTERPIIFSTPMVQAIEEGIKTQTRRIVKPQPVGGDKIFSEPMGFFRVGRLRDSENAFRPINPPARAATSCTRGDRIWVREAWAQGGYGIVFRASYAYPDFMRWKPSIHLKRKDARILLEVTEVRAERLQDISAEDAAAEGVTKQKKFFSMDWSELGKERKAVTDGRGGKVYATEDYLGYDNPVGAFAAYWEKINGAGSWYANPWVWIIEFRKVSK